MINFDHYLCIELMIMLNGVLLKICLDRIDTYVVSCNTFQLVIIYPSIFSVLKFKTENMY